MKPASFQVEASQFIYERDHSMLAERRGRWKRPGTLRQRIKWRSKKNKKTGCIEWLGGKTPKGYARIWWAGRGHRVARIVWVMAKGAIPHGLKVLHKCDNTSCIRLGHLFLGTDADNMRDRDRKGRQARGERVYRAVLTPARVRYIRRVKTTASKLAIRFKVAISTICHARNGATWRHL